MRATLWIGRMMATAAVLALATAVALAQEPSSGAPPMSAEEQAMMAKWQAFMTPGEQHALLASKAGTWNMKVTSWMDPAAPPQTSEGTSEMTMILGGRYLQDVTHSTFNGMPFEGRGLCAFDNIKKKFVSTWIDNMGTGVMISEGTYDPATKTMESMGSSPDVVAGAYTPMKSVDHYTSPDRWTSEMYSKTKDGKGWWKMMSIEYTRKK